MGKETVKTHRRRGRSDDDDDAAEETRDFWRAKRIVEEAGAEQDKNTLRVLEQEVGGKGWRDDGGFGGRAGGSASGSCMCKRSPGIAGGRSPRYEDDVTVGLMMVMMTV